MRPWFPWYPNDYAADTRFISPMADLVYRRLLDQYWINKGPLPLNYAALARSIGLDTRVVKRYLTTELAEHWEVIKTDNETDTPIAMPIATYVATQQLSRSKSTSDVLLFNERMQAEIEISNEKHELAKKAGRIGGLAKAKANAKANALAMSQPHPPIKDMQPAAATQNSQNDEIPEQVENKPKRNNVPYQKIVDLYHEILSDLPRVQILTTKRKAQISARHADLRKDLDNWRKYFGHIQLSDFLMGRVQPTNGRKPFIADLEWITNASNFAKIAEGRYNE